MRHCAEPACSGVIGRGRTTLRAVLNPPPPRPPSAPAGGRSTRPGSGGRPAAPWPAAARCGRTRSRRARCPAWRSAQLQVLLADQPLLQHLHLVAEQRRLEALAPDLGVEHARPSAALNHSSASGPSVRSVRVSVAASQPLARHLAQRGVEGRAAAASASVQPAAIAWPPKRSSSPGWRLLTRSSASRRWKPGIERPEPLSTPVGAAREDEGRPVQAVLHAAGDDADHALVERRVEQRQRRRRVAVGASAARSAASACSRMPASTSRRSRLMASSCAASRRRAPGRR